MYSLKVQAQGDFLIRALPTGPVARMTVETWRETMTWKLTIPFAALAIMGCVTTANAAPAATAAAALKADVTDALGLEVVSYGRCWRFGRYVSCARPGPQVYGFYYAPRPYYSFRPSYRYWGWRRW